MLTFTPDGKYLLVARRDTSDDYQIDPEGSVSVIDVTDPDNLQVRTADFTAFNSQRAQLVADGVRVFGPGASVAQDMEPEYITVSADSTTAWVALQENNALAKVDIASATITEILPLGYKDHGIKGQGLDASDACLAGSQRDIPCAEFFNSNHSAGDSFLNRSDNKGPEPEAVTSATFGDRTFAFLGLERMGGVMVFDITNPQSPSIVDYLNTREEWVMDPETNLAIVGDLGIEDITVIPADQSPNGDVLLLTGNEVSGTTAVYRVVLQYAE